MIHWSEKWSGRLRKGLGVLVLFFLSCAGAAIGTDVEPPRQFTDNDQEHPEGVLETLFLIRQRNRVVEDDDHWITESYKKLMIRNLSDIPASDYQNYSSYLDNGSAYIVVHPGFYIFFHSDRIEGRSDRDNVVEKFLMQPSSSPKVRVLKLQEKTMRDFLEYMSSRNRLVILLLPGKYKKDKRYQYRDGANEYVRYLNEVTNGSPSVLYLYTRRLDDGRLSAKKMKMLLDFLSTAGARDVLLGGGYFGRCLSGFQMKMEKHTKRDIYLVPELIQVSPEDLSLTLSLRLINSDGMLDAGIFSEYLTEKIAREEYKDFSGFKNLNVVSLN
ncbi:MAG: hypothetical protein ACM34I_09585 [bacterium]